MDQQLELELDQHPPPCLRAYIDPSHVRRCALTRSYPSVLFCFLSFCASIESPQSKAIARPTLERNVDRAASPSFLSLSLLSHQSIESIHPHVRNATHARTRVRLPRRHFRDDLPTSKKTHFFSPNEPYRTVRRRRPAGFLLASLPPSGMLQCISCPWPSASRAPRLQILHRGRRK